MKASGCWYNAEAKTRSESSKDEVLPTYSSPAFSVLRGQKLLRAATRGFEADFDGGRGGVMNNR
jgi:hypothetical protein